MEFTVRDKSLQHFNTILADLRHVKPGSLTFKGYKHGLVMDVLKKRSVFARYNFAKAYFAFFAIREDEESVGHLRSDDYTTLNYYKVNFKQLYDTLSMFLGVQIAYFKLDQVTCKLCVVINSPTSLIYGEFRTSRCLPFNAMFFEPNSYLAKMHFPYIGMALSVDEAFERGEGKSIFIIEMNHNFLGRYTNRGGVDMRFPKVVLFPTRHDFKHKFNVAGQYVFKSQKLWPLLGFALHCTDGPLSVRVANGKPAIFTTHGPLCKVAFKVEMEFNIPEYYLEMCVDPGSIVCQMNRDYVNATGPFDGGPRHDIRSSLLTKELILSARILRPDDDDDDDEIPEPNVVIFEEILTDDDDNDYSTEYENVPSEEIESETDSIADYNTGDELSEHNEPDQEDEAPEQSEQVESSEESDSDSESESDTDGENNPKRKKGNDGKEVKKKKKKN